MAPPRTTLWKCPECGDRFLTKNRRHSCGKFRLEPLLEVCEPATEALFRKLVSTMKGFGPVRVVPKKSMVIFQATRRFACAIPGKAQLRVSFMHPRRIEDARFRKVHTFRPTAHEYTLVLGGERDLDAPLVGWLGEAYRSASDDRPDIPPAIARRFR